MSKTRVMSGPKKAKSLAPKAAARRWRWCDSAMAFFSHWIPVKWTEKLVKNLSGWFLVISKWAIDGHFSVNDEQRVATGWGCRTLASPKKCWSCNIDFGNLGSSGSMCCDLYIPGTHLSFVLPPKQGLNSNQNKGPHLGSRYTYKWLFRFRYSFGVCFFQSEKLLEVELTHLGPGTHIWVFPKIMVPPNHPFKNRVFRHKPSILGAHPYFWKHPYPSIKMGGVSQTPGSPGHAGHTDEQFSTKQLVV